MPNPKLDLANAILDEWHEAGRTPVMHWRNCWYEFDPLSQTYYRRSAAWMFRRVAERVSAREARRLVCGPLIALCLQPDMVTYPPLPPGPRGRVQRPTYDEESN